MSRSHSKLLSMSLLRRRCLPTIPPKSSLSNVDQSVIIGFIDFIHKNVSKIRRKTTRYVSFNILEKGKKNRYRTMFEQNTGIRFRSTIEFDRFFFPDYYTLLQYTQ